MNALTQPPRKFVLSQASNEPAEPANETRQGFAYRRFRFTLDCSSCEEPELPASFLRALDDLAAGRVLEMETALRDDPARVGRPES